MADLRKLIASMDKMNEGAAKAETKPVIAEGSMLKALNMVSKSVAPAAELAKEYKIFKEAAKWRADDLEDKVWTRDEETGEKIPAGGNDGYPGDELTGRPGSWGGKYKRMTKQGKPTQHELGMQNNTKMRMKVQKQNGGLTGPKGPLPEEAKYEHPVSSTGHKVIKKTAQDLQNPPKVMQHRAKRDQERDAKWMSTQLAKNESINEEAGEPNVDDILYYLTSAYRHLQQNADFYQDFSVITHVYEVLRYDLKAGDYAAFQRTYENCLAKYPDASVELFDAMFVEAGLPEEQGTIEQFLEKCSGMQEGYDDEEHPIRDDGNEGRPGKARYPGTATEGIGDTIKRGVKNIKRGMQGWGGVQSKPSEIVKRNKGYDDKTVKNLNLKGKIYKDVDGAPEPHSPQALQNRVLDREMKKRGLGESFGVFHRMSEGAAPIKTFALKEDAMAMAKRYNKINRDEGVRYVVRNIAEAMPAAVSTATTKMNPGNAAPAPQAGTSTPSAPGAPAAPKVPGPAGQPDPAVAKAQQAAYQKNIAKLGAKDINAAQAGVSMQKQADDMQLTPNDNTNNAKIAGTLANVLKDPGGAQALKTLTDKYNKKPGQA